MKNLRMLIMRTPKSILRRCRQTREFRPYETNSTSKWTNYDETRWGINLRPKMNCWKSDGSREV